MTDQQEQSERQKRIAARQENLRSRTPPARTVQVEPTKDDYRKFLKHPTGGGFPASGAATWPDDNFTHRRVKDGSVKKVEQQPQPHATHRRAPVHAE